MPKFLEQELKSEYSHATKKRKALKGKELAHAVYGTMNAIGAMHGNKITAKGERMQAKHERDVESGGALMRRRRG